MAGRMALVSPAAAGVGSGDPYPRSRFVLPLGAADAAARVTRLERWRPCSRSSAGPATAPRAHSCASRRRPCRRRGRPKTPGPEPQPVTITSYGAQGDVATVQMSDGTRWQVTRKRSTVPIVKKRGQFGVGVGSDDADRIWLKASWCRGTRGEIRVGGNPQGAAKELLKNLAQGIANGGDADEVKRIITAAEIQPFVDWDIQRPGDWKITGEVKLDFDKSGLKSAGGKVGVAKGPFEGGIEGKGDRDGSWNVTVTGKYAGRQDQDQGGVPGGRAALPLRVRMRARDRREGEEGEGRARCHGAVPRAPLPLLQVLQRRGQQGAHPEGGARRPRRPDGRRLQGRQRPGLHVARGPARPVSEVEGGQPRPRHAAGKGSRSPTRRARTAAVSPAASRPPRTSSCSHRTWRPSTAGRPSSRARSSRRTSSGPGSTGTDEDIREQKTPAADKRVKAARGRHAKAEVIYEYLRRSRIDLERVESDITEREVITPAHVDRKKGNCPKDVLEAARTAWFASGAVTSVRCPTIGPHALDHDQVAVRAARARRARALGRRRSGPDRRARPPARHPGPVPRAALRGPAPRRRPALPARREGRLLVRPRAGRHHRPGDRRAARRPARRAAPRRLRRGRRGGPRRARGAPPSPTSSSARTARPAPRCTTSKAVPL